MKAQPENTEHIALYLAGELPPKEKEIFEKMLHNDPVLQENLAQYKTLLDSIELHQKRTKLRHQLDAFHEEMKVVSPLVAKTSLKTQKHFSLNWRRHLPNLMVAASVAVLAIFTTIWVLDDSVRSIEQQQKNYFLSLRRDLNKVKAKQDRIAQNQKDAQTPKPVKEYGATAFVISSNGYLVTNYHVVKDADSIYVESDREGNTLSFKVENVYNDPEKDLAVLRIIDPEFIGFAELPFSLRNDEAYLGEDVFTLAYPRQEMVYGEGSISAQSGYRGDTLMYQISIPVNPGNSGGPLLDAEGNLIGVVVGKHIAMDGAAFAVKIKHLKNDLDSLSKNTEIPPVLIPQSTHIKTLKRPEQIKLLKDFVFVVRVYNGK